MTYLTHIRSYEGSDSSGVISLLNLYDEYGIAGNAHQDSESKWQPDFPRMRLVAVDEEGVCGYAKAGRRNSDLPGRFGVTVFVHPRAAGHGVGRELLERAEGFAHDLGAKFLVSAVRDTSHRGLAFGERAGYRSVQHLFESVLNLATFEPSPYQERRAKLERGGYRFFSLAEVGDNEENRRRLHKLDSFTDEDTPGIENWGPRTFEQYCLDEFDSRGYTPDGVQIASLGSDWVGMNSIRESLTRGRFEVDYTGVHKEHWGRGIAQVLKAIGIDFALRAGGHEMSTFNDDRNGPMIAINRKLGFVPKPGFTTLRKNLEI